MPSLSICTIVKNEEKNIRDFIESFLPIADEFLIADTGSSDGTVAVIKELAAVHKNIVFCTYTFEGPFHFGKARNFLFDRARNEYQLVIDADERPSKEFIEGVREFFQKEKPVVATVVRRDNLVPHLIDRTVGRFVQRSAHIRYETGPSSQVHEHLEYSGEVKCFEGVLWHCQGMNHYVIRPQRILPQLELQIDRVPKTKSFPGHLLRGIWYFFYRFNKLYFKRGLYHDGGLGFKYAFMRAVDAFLIEFFVGLKPNRQSQEKMIRDGSETTKTNQ